MSLDATPVDRHVSVVVPVYRNADTLFELSHRLMQVFDRRGDTFELVFVDDACPAGSGRVLEKLAADNPRIAVVSMERNGGQHRAVLAGMQHCRGEQVVVLDADLQDPPEAIPELLDGLRDGAAAVFAGRRGAYESLPRLATSRVFKFLMHLLCGIPRDAGMFVAVNREVVTRVLQYEPPRPFVSAMIACTGLPMRSIPVWRDKRRDGRSAYSFVSRLAAGRDAIWCVLSCKSHSATPSLDPRAVP